MNRKIFREMNVFEIRYMNRHVVHVLTCHHHPIDFRKFKRLDATAPFFFFFDKNGLRFLSNMKRRIKPGWGYIYLTAMCQFFLAMCQFF